MTPLEVACAVEGGDYVAHTAAMLHSLLARRPGGGARVHLLHGPDESARRLGKLARMVDALGGELVLRRVTDPRLDPLPRRGFTRTATWYRILLPELVPEPERVLYLDADTIVTDDLAPLWGTELRGHLVAAVTNVLEPWNAGRPAQLGLPGPGAYFNAGVLLFDLAGLRRSDATTEMLRVGAERSDELTWRDQDLLNIVLGERRLALHPRWNAMNSLLFTDWAEPVFGAEAVAEARRNPAIRHFEGPAVNKPWHLLCEREGRADYFAHRAGTPWPRVRRTGVTPRNLLVLSRARRDAARRRGRAATRPRGRR